MSVLTPKRVVPFIVVFLLLLLTPAVFASTPSPRTLARMVYDDKAAVALLFGGRGPVDSATQVAHNTNETWLWTGAAWHQRFPLTQPPARAAHSMVYDSRDDLVVMFGGRQEAAEVTARATMLNDTWVWNDHDWIQVNTADAPSPRHYAGLAYDPIRDRVVLFGGNVHAADGKTVEPIYDTWEFDGVNWTRVGTTGVPPVAKPILAWDGARGEIIMMGVNNADLSRVMYRYDAGAQSWTQVTPETLPTCINEGSMVYDRHNQVLVWFGGVCPTGTPSLEEVFTWDGTNWTKVESSDMTRAAGQAVAYDAVRRQIVTYGGTSFLSAVPRGLTTTFANGRWRFAFDSNEPAPRSLAAFEPDFERGNVWLFGGLDDLSSGYLGDLWGYRDYQWFRVTASGGPGETCGTPLSAYDRERATLVVVCGGSVVWEWNGTEWKQFADLKTVPDPRRFAGLVYDQKLKKTVLFGGYTVNYRNDTWLWDGAQWTQSKGNKPTHRGLMAMWYDPLQQKTIVYGGFGRADIDEKIKRYDDMWSFDGTNWTKMSVTSTPGARFGPQIAVDPQTNRLLLFGGLRSEEPEGKLRQFYDNDMWEWNGSTSTWTQLHPSRVPPARENGMLAWDPFANRMVLFGGYGGGFFFSDVWFWDGETWSPRVTSGGRRRAAGRISGPADPPSND